ncbi:MAG: S9 family peptidase [Bryobacteraceae bacterium]
MKKPVSRTRAGVAKLSLQQLYRTRTIGAGRWSPDGKRICFVSNASGRRNLWIAESDGGWPQQLTVSDQRQIPGSWSPDGKWITFQSDYDGNEQWDLFAVSTRTGDGIALTDTPEISEESPVWSPNGKFIAYHAKAKSSPSYEIHVMEFAGLRAREVTTGTPKDFSNQDPVWSPDGRYLAYTSSRADQKLDIIYVADLRTGTRWRVTPPDGEHNYHATAWSPGGTKLLVTSNALNRVSNVALLDRRSGEMEWITRGEWDSEAGEFRGHWIAYETNVDGNTEVFLYDTQKKIASRVPSRVGLNSLGSHVFAPDGKRILFYYGGPTEPRDIYTYAIGAPKPVRVTRSAMAALDTSSLVEPFLVHYDSFDGLRISAFLYIPFNLKHIRRAPGIVLVHGGPSAQSMNGFNRDVQYLVNSGYLVIAPNYRGSTGYGKDFEEKNRFDMGGGDLQDVVFAAKYLYGTGYVARNRIAIVGGSYGGYMTMMGLTQTPEIWAAGVAIVPFVNWFTELEHEDPALREWDLATMGDPVANRELYESRSPINFVDRVQAPLLVLAGGNDPRCPREESDQIAEAIRSRGGVVEYMFYQNEGHGFARIENAIDSFERTVTFLNHYMK